MLLDGLVVVVTGAGRGMGRAHALEFSEHGARIVVNDVGSDPLGRGVDDGPAEEVAELIRQRGGEAIADHHDISDWQQSRTLVTRTVNHFGSLDGLVNNAGTSGWQDIADLEEDFLDRTLQVHLKGTFACSRHACEYWRSRFRSGGRGGAIVNTVSENGMGVVAHRAPYAAAKAGIAILTLATCVEGAAYGVRANAVAPQGVTRMWRTGGLMDMDPDQPIPEADQYVGDAPMHPRNSSPLFAWLLSDEAAHVSGQVFRMVGSSIALWSPWSATDPIPPPNGARFHAAEIARHVAERLFTADMPSVYQGASIPLPPDSPAPLR